MRTEGARRRIDCTLAGLVIGMILLLRAEELELQYRGQHGLRETPVEIVVERHDVRPLEREHETVAEVGVGGEVERLAAVVLQAALRAARRTDDEGRIVSFLIRSE